ncbi:Cof-type HAD-IIB family hydrolase [Aerococcus urinae]|uniref:Cof-type HAD-IIB family hydrolase n=1 Tax=Aerococcus urinae TaxID=1376 RepID=A0A0X8FFL0_9LACT|nr:Cof-type HAD-IIB family hydrolase [Aerococcus urinae]AMB96372.1 hypothetical protein AWM73_07615 [Aerococcus urinae]MCY3032260.1 Cof-type HAD-IIB family hydrolase [Aerococcus urinae]MCY3037765.1 Cof-type HAD-IIB family hydrolase [Aerococcus urinae]MCY3044306.1 Cof-type HAD-IIB family hydrolase [Aerococcus urinae]MCY3045567.1 Cof-type HAD-IIB family hydrolase [Aerococcus urinae]
MYRLAAFDVDGTLLKSDSSLSEATHQALKTMKESGIEIVISSGRPLPGVELIQDLVGKDLVRYLSSFNGGRIVDTWSDNQVIFEAILPPAEVGEICDFLADYDVDINTYDDHNVLGLKEPNHQYMAHEAQLTGMPIKIENFVETEAKVNKLMVTGDPAYLETVRQDLPEDWFNRWNIVKSAPYFLEFNPVDANKGAGLAHLSQEIGVDQAQTMAFGDQENDLTMIEWAGLGVAMGNAVASVKAVADFVTHTNDEEGISHVVDQFINKN